jgi:hypothetical protein
LVLLSEIIQDKGGKIIGTIHDQIILEALAGNADVISDNFARYDE